MIMLKIKKKLTNIDVKIFVFTLITLFIGKISILINKMIYMNRFLIGKNYKVWGNLRLIIDGEGKIIIGDDFHAVSSRSRSYYTLFSPCHLTSLHGGVIEFGNHVGLNGTIIASRKKIFIGNDTMIGPNTIIMDHNGHTTKAINRWLEKDHPKEIHIGENCWIGMNCIILKGVTIGNNTVIGAGSIVRNNCDSDSIYAGNPAVKIRNINKEN
jgi:acetyltransferase-like isoleucine patch superfamily enzyme